MAWNEADVPNQDGRTAVVTGANSGLGYETTGVLAERGATVVMACRSVERGEAAAAEIQRTGGDGRLVVVELDLADLDSVRTFPDRLASTNRNLRGIDVLINNAGVMAIPRRETEDGFEKQFGVNHLGHFALTGVLFELLAPDARVVTVSSMMHEYGEMEFEDLHGEESYDKWDAYAQSKLANVLFSYELDRRVNAADEDVTSISVHPGFADTGLQARGPEMAGSKLRLAFMRFANAVFAQSAASGALPTLYAATSPDVDGGEYYGPGGLFNMRGAPEQQESAAPTYDREAARNLWEGSTDQTEITYELPKPEPPA